MDEVASHKHADPWRDVIYLTRYEDEDPVSDLTSEAEAGVEDYSQGAYGHDDSENLDDQGNDAELDMTDAEVESILSAAPDLPEVSDFAVISNGSGTDHEPSQNPSGTPMATSKRGNNATKLTEATLNSLRRSASAAARSQAPPSPKPFLRSSSSMAAARRLDNNGSSANGKGVRKLEPPIISAPPVIRSRATPREASNGTNTIRSSTNTLRSSTNPLRSSTNTLRSSTNTLRSSTNTLRPSTSTSAVRSSTGSGAITGLRKPSLTTDPRRSSLTTLPTSSAGVSRTDPRRSSSSKLPTTSAGVSRRNSLSGVTSMSKSVDLPSASDLSQWVSPAPALKASGRRVINSSAASSQVAGNSLNKTSPTVASKPLSKTSPSPAKSRSSATNSPILPRSSPVPPSPTPSRKSPVPNGVTKTETETEMVKKKLTPSPSLGARKPSSSFAEPVRKLSVSPSFSNTSTTKSSPSERRMSLSTPKPSKFPTEKQPSITQSKGMTKSSPPERFLSSAKVVKSSPESVPAASSAERLAKSKASSAASASSNGSEGPKNKSPSPMPSKKSPSPVTSDRGPSMLNRRKSLVSDTRDPKIVALPSVDVKAGDDVRLDLRGQKVRTLDGNMVSLTPKMEFVYLRDNKLATLHGIEILRRVKVLDLSFNDFKGAGLEPLSSCKALQQLYLAGNQITSLSDLPLLPNLEFLSVAQNKIKSLSMASQPRLQVLAASKNRISTFKDFPHLPALEHLRLEENPILESFHVEAQAILLVGPSLKKFNDRDLSIQELELARMYPPSTGLCIRDGWELCEPEEALESTLQFLVSKWSPNLPPGYTVKKAWVDQPAEEDPCSCEFVFDKLEGAFEDTELLLKYQWFVGAKTPANFTPIDGADTDTYWPKHEHIGNCFKVECSIVLGETEYPSVFAVSPPVAAGSKCPRVLQIEVEGQTLEGATLKGLAIVAWCGGTPGKSVSSWLRRGELTSPVAILGAEEPEYKPTLDDVGFSLIYMYTPVTDEGMRGEPQYAATGIIHAASPSVNTVQIVGEAVDGSVLHGRGTYFGGQEGASKYEWLRENLESGEFKLVSRGELDYNVAVEDVGRRMMFMYTPVNAGGKIGDPASAVSPTVVLAPPKVENLRVVGDLREGSKVAVSAIFTRGVEGASLVQWFKKSDPSLPTDDASLEPLCSAKVAKAFRIPLSAVGHYLVAKYTPMRLDGESGKPVYAMSETIVETLPPGFTFLNIVGDFVEGETLTAQYGYVGGYEGSSLYSWYLHDTENDPGAVVPEAEGQLQYRISRQAVNKLVSFRCRPVRDDGIMGDWQTSHGAERIRAGSPKLLSLHIMGEPIEGNELQVGKEYWGGEEGICKVQWFLTRQDGTQREIKGAVHEFYTVQSDDADCLICVSCQPVRSDGVAGPVAVSSSVGPVVPSAPTCNSLEICGLPVEGGCLAFQAAYKGGEKGTCMHEWVRHNVDGSEVLLSADEVLDLTSEDVGGRIELIFTPVRKDGSVGNSRSTITDVVVDGEPEGTDLMIPQCFEDVEVVPRKLYFGGKEGKSEYTWYRTAYRPKDGQLPEDARLLGDREVYTPKLEEVGSHLVLHWVPVRADGKRGTPIVSYSNLPVAPALPVVRSVSIKEVAYGTFEGEGEYYGGLEGESQMSWYRQTTGGLRTLITEGHSKTYEVCDDDYTCTLVFGYTPVRNDGVTGELVLSDPSPVLYPELPRIQKLVISGKPVEGEVLTALEVIPKGEVQQRSWEKYKKDIKYQWLRSVQPESLEHFEPLPAQRSCTYKVRLEDVGYCLRCEGIISDVFSRSAEPAVIITPPVAPGFPRVENLEVEGRGFHTSLYAVRGIYSGGKEGTSMIQWFRAMAGSPDLIPISGEVGRMYEANVDDVGYRLVAVYTPVREDGVEGGPVSASTDPIIVDPEVSKEVKLKLELGVVKFEALRDRDRSPMKGQNQQGLGTSLERRVLDVNRKRVKVVKPGSKTHFASTELRGTYAPPFHVEVFRNDQHRVKIVMDSENEVDLMVQSRHIRDIIVLVIRGFSQRFNSTPLNLLLKM